MRHRVAHRKLGRVTPHRIALLRNLATALFERERIRTTLAKAKELRPYAEKLITMAKREDDRSHAKRLVGRDIRDPKVVTKLFDSLGARFATRPGGYTRILRLGPRKGDGAEMAIVELLGSEYQPGKKDEKAKKGEEGAPKAKAEPRAPPRRSPQRPRRPGRRRPRRPPRNSGRPARAGVLRRVPWRTPCRAGSRRLRPGASRSAEARLKLQDETASSAAGRKISGPSAPTTVVPPAAFTENRTRTVPTAPAIRASGGGTGRRPRTRSGTPGDRAISRIADTPFSTGAAGPSGFGGGAVSISTGGCATLGGGAGFGGSDAVARAGEGVVGGVATRGRRRRGWEPAERRREPGRPAAPPAAPRHSGSRAVGAVGERAPGSRAAAAELSSPRRWPWGLCSCAGCSDAARPCRPRPSIRPRRRPPP